MKLITVTVNPGDWGAKFRIEPGGENRPVANARLQALNEDWHPNVGVLALRYGVGGFYVLDGQHRICVASDFRSEPTTFKGILYEEADFAGLSVGAHITGWNDVRRFNLVDFLRARRAESLWPNIFERAGVDLHFGQSGHTLGWAPLLRGRATGQMALDRKSATVWSPSTSDILQWWLTTDTALIDETLAFTRWWIPIGRAASVRGVRTLHGAIGVTVGFTFWSTQSEAVRKKVADRISTYPALGNFTAVRTGKQLAYDFMAAVNYKSPKPLSLFGVTGREEQ